MHGLGALLLRTGVLATCERGAGRPRALGDTIFAAVVAAGASCAVGAREEPVRQGAGRSSASSAGRGPDQGAASPFTASGSKPAPRSQFLRVRSVYVGAIATRTR